MEEKFNFPRGAITNVSPPKEIVSLRELIDLLSDEEKVGQMLMFGFYNDNFPSWSKEFLEERRIGGVLLVRRNIKSAAQLKALTPKIQSFAATETVPMLIAVDQEGGAA